MCVKSLNSVNPTAHKWVLDCQLGEVCVYLCVCTTTRTLRQSSVALFAFMQVDTLVSLLQALTAFHYWEKKKGSLWQQLLEFVGCNASDEIIQT